MDEDIRSADYDEEAALMFEDNDENYEGDDAMNSSQYQQFEVIDYEALAQRKRKALCDLGTAKRPRVEDTSLADFDEAMEKMSLRRPRTTLRQPKKKGRRKGGRVNLNSQVSKMLGEANIYYANGEYEDAIRVLKEVVLVAPNLSEIYYTLGIVHEDIGDKKKSLNFYMLAAQLAPIDHQFLWKRMSAMSIEQGNTGQATYCLDKAIKVDPEDTDLIASRAAIYVQIKEYDKAAALYYRIVELSPDNVEACIMAAKLFHKSNQADQAIRLLEDYVKGHSAEGNIIMTNLLVSLLMESGEHAKAIQQIERIHLVYDSQKKLPIHLTVKAGICHVHLGNIKDAEILFSVLETECVEDVTDLITEVAETFMNKDHCRLALKYYLKLEGNGFLHLRIAKCYQSLMERNKAITYYYRALCVMEDNVDVRISLASLLTEEGKENEVIALLSPPKLSETASKRPWWSSGKVKKKLAEIYLGKEMLVEFVDTILPPISETLRFRPKQRLPTSVLLQRAKILEVHQDDYVIHGFRPLGSPLELAKAARAKREIQRREALKEEKKAAGIDWYSDDSDNETTQIVPPFPNLLKDNEHFQLILDLCKALSSLKRNGEALKIIEDTQRLRSLSDTQKEEVVSLENQISVKFAMQRQPKSIADWNYYYKVRAENKLQKPSRLLNLVMRTDPECVPPRIISGHRFTLNNMHQDAARKYLEAYKLQPNNPLINLCAGTALINIALGFRIQNTHQCLAQGFAFLHNNMRLCENSQEALYNIARAYHHVGLVTLAVLYYEKVLATCEEDYPNPKLPIGDLECRKVQQGEYCNLRREAAYNLHLIYKKSGALDLARKVLRCHCTP
ncbi:hypothetical protein ACHQM5_021260 [Ranunculus cassubicifolius]